jgi:general secretion pathway protein J
MAVPLLMPHLQRAFSLIEMLVVMVIVSLLITVIIQGFGYSLGVYQRVQHSQKTAYTEVLAYDWLRTTLGAAVAARPKDHGLEGSSQVVSSYSYQPLIDPLGLKTLIVWRLQQEGDDVNLEYQENQSLWPVYHWPNAHGSLEYLDTKGQWHSQWPVEKSDLPALPEAVRLLISSGAEVRNYVVVINTRKRSEVTMDEALYGH